LAKVQAVGQRLTDIVALYGATAADWRSAQSAPKVAAPAKVPAPEGVKSLAPTGQSP
jgi:hypothetical protein